jgi:predicted adenylyl cyclase CyaB
MTEQFPDRLDAASHPGPPRARRNVELKARVASLEPLREIAERLATQRLGRQVQTDTYFHCRNGRLKLREISAQEAQLIWYCRPDVADAKTSSYYLTPVADPALLKKALGGALGVQTVVVKQRDVYLHHNVRIHLDDVQQLGCFLELEAVLSAESDARAGREQVERLREEFAIAASDLLTSSYGDML